MCSRSPWKEDLVSILKLAWPVVLAELGWMLQGVVDVIMVGHLGPVAIGAVALGNALYYAPSLFGLGVLLGLDTVVAHAYGRKDYDACHRWFAQGVYIALVAAPLLMAFLFALGFGLPYFKVAPVLIVPSRGYLNILLWGTLPLLLYAASRRYLQGVGQVRVITVAYVGSNLLNWGANWVLINGKFGLPAMGVRGSALSTVIARCMMATTLFWFAWRYEKRRGHPLFARWAAPHLSEIRQLLRLGLPSAAQLIFEVGAFGLATILAGDISPAALAAHQIALNYSAMAYMVPLGISAAASISVGHAIGANDFARARRAGWLTMSVAIVFMGFVAVLFFSAPQPLIALYTHDAMVSAIGGPLFRLAAAYAVFDGLQITATGALRGLGHTRVPMLANLAGYWAIGIPVGMYLCFRTGYGVYGLWIGLTMALVVISIALFTYWAKTIRTAVR